MPRGRGPCARRARLAPLDHLLTRSSPPSRIVARSKYRRRMLGATSMRVHDVTLTLRPGMPTWPGEDGPRVEPLKRMARGDSSNVSVVTFGDHTGTHVDPPVHFLE